MAEKSDFSRTEKLKREIRVELEWERMRMGMQEARPVFEHFRREVDEFLARLEEDG